MKRAKQTNSDRMPGRAISSRKFRSFVLYGRSGTGKTTLASSFPTDGAWRWLPCASCPHNLVVGRNVHRSVAQTSILVER